MAIYKELYLDKDAIIFLTFHEQNIIAVGNVDDIMSAIEDEIGNKLIEQYKKYNRRLTNAEISKLSKEQEDFPALSTILRYFQTTKMSEVWNDIEKEIQTKS